MKELMEWCYAIEKICSELQWKTQTKDMGEYIMILCPVAEDMKIKGILFILSSSSNRIMMSVSYRIVTRPEQRVAILETISRINFGLIGGGIEIDPDNKEIRYRDGLFLSESEPDIQLLKAFVATTLRDALGYYPEIESIA